MAIKKVKTAEEQFKDKGLDLKEEILRRAKQGMYRKEISLELGFHASTIAEYAKKYGIKIKKVPVNKNWTSQIKINNKKR